MVEEGLYYYSDDDMMMTTAPYWIASRCALNALLLLQKRRRHGQQPMGGEDALTIYNRCNLLATSSTSSILHLSLWRRI